MYKGSCLCGSVSFLLKGRISDIIHCHCSLCRKASGSAYATNGFIDAADFEVTDTEASLTFYESAAGKRKYFCKCCGAPIYSENTAKPGRYRLRLGALDSDINERPMSHNFVTSKASWEDLDAGLPRYERYEPGRE
ncbi:GFA family protein [Shewanella khirikhana]|uniref:Glutathione-dependent formaldehyde-activating enzyme n=1 Tax=Shewanella khirikhana TaxID=1965282 RepID=A0ABM7D2C1_9GAMM|nr:GFA family protein [Shewanella khirikhana]AZQ10430.1 glutathione-dependent formaldehyde-activating enzyme [Shewanella khirikhana]